MSTDKKNSFKWSAVPMTAEAHLLDTKLFRRAVLTPIALGFFMMLVAALGSWNSLSFCIEAKCFNTFFGLFKYQFAVMGLAIPLGALVASHHRSIQAADQIKTQLNQNVFSNHIDHRELFEQFFKDNNPLSLTEMKSQQTWWIYGKIFPQSAYGDLTPSEDIEDFLNIVEAEFSEIVDLAINELSPTTLDLSNSKIPAKFVCTNLAISIYLRISRPTHDQGIMRNPIAALEEYVTRIPEIAIGLQDCANFYQIYEEYSAVKAIEDKLLDISNLLLDLQPYSKARAYILNALENATDKNGNFKATDPYASGSLRRRLNDFARGGDVTEHIDPKAARVVFDNYLSKHRQKVLLDHLPDVWEKEFADQLGSTPDQ